MLALGLGAAWLWSLWAWLGLHPSLHSDALYLYDLLSRLGAGGTLASWDLPPGPSLFPDLGLLWLAKKAAPQPVECLRFYGLIMGFWLWRVLAGLLRELLGLDKAASRSLAAAGLLLGLVLTPAEGGLAAWLLPSHHGAAFVAALSVWAWGLRQRRKPSGFWATQWLALLAGLLLSSDLFFAFWALLPLALLALRLRREGQQRLAMGLFTALAMGWVSMTWMRAYAARVPHVNWDFVLGPLRPSSWSVLGLLGGLGLRQGAALLGAALAGLGLWAWPLPGRDDAPAFALGAWALASLSSLLACVMLASVSGRYFYVLLLVPVLLLPALLAERKLAWAQAAVLAPLLAVLLWTGAPADAAQPPLELRQAAWLDQQLAPRGLRYGLAEYGQARPLRLFSRSGAQMAPVVLGKEKVDPYLWIGDRLLLSEGGALMAPQYVVVNGLDEAGLLYHFGPPKERLSGEGLQLWILPVVGKR